jgi:hypothetical protein
MRVLAGDKNRRRSGNASGRTPPRPTTDIGILYEGRSASPHKYCYQQRVFWDLRQLTKVSSVDTIMLAASLQEIKSEAPHPGHRDNRKSPNAVRLAEDTLINP